MIALNTANIAVSASGPEQVCVSVVVPAHNASATLRRCLCALIMQDIGEPYEIIVVDDGSTDATSSIAKEYSPQVMLMCQPHRGAASARNRGVAAASGEIVLFTDADCEPIQGWVGLLVKVIRDGAAGVKGTYRTRQKSITARFVQAEYEGKYGRMARLPHIDFIDTYSAGYQRSIFMEAGGFDEGISAVEDQELSFRVAESGYNLRFVPEAAVYHIHAATPHAYLRKKFWIGYWKVQVAALHPNRIVSDSHTPPSIKAQMALLLLGLCSLILAPLSSVARKTLSMCSLSFLATTTPFLVRTARQYPGVALATPGLMLLRAVGLTFGALCGIRRFGSHLIRRAGYTAAKRGIDLALASVGLALASPVMALIAVAICADSRGPAIFVQWRVGQDGKLFRMYKFRTMVHGAEGLRAQLVKEMGLDEPVLKLRPDPRITRIGRFLRRWSLDETPQLLNVLKGEMSLVGPRPEEPGIVSMYSPWHRQRLRATPGVTGPMQVSGRANLSLDERVQVELTYIEQASIVADIRILVRTISAVLSGDGSY